MRSDVVVGLIKLGGLRRGRDEGRDEEWMRTGHAPTAGEKFVVDIHHSSVNVHI
jgi:hypothetical protein